MSKKKFEFWLVAFDETEHWNLPEEMMRHIERIDCVYLFNRLEQTHACELTPSYWLVPVKSVPIYKDWKNIEEGVAEEIEDEIRVWEETEGRYVHCRDIEGLIQEEQTRRLQAYRRKDGKVQLWKTEEIDLQEEYGQYVSRDEDEDILVGRVFDDYVEYAASNHEFVTWRE